MVTRLAQEEVSGHRYSILGNQALETWGKVGSLRGSRDLGREREGLGSRDLGTGEREGWVRRRLGAPLLQTWESSFFLETWGRGREVKDLET